MQIIFGALIHSVMRLCWKKIWIACAQVQRSYLTVDMAGRPLSLLHAYQSTGQEAAGTALKRKTSGLVMFPAGTGDKSMRYSPAGLPEANGVKQ